MPLSLGGHTYTVINSLSSLASYSGALGFYAIGQNIDATGSSYTSTVMAALVGGLNGLGHTINNLTSTGGNGGGLIGNVGSSSNSTSTVSNLGLTNVSITTTNSGVGGLAKVNYGTLTNDFVTGTRPAALSAGWPGLTAPFRAAPRKWAISSTLTPTWP